MKRDKASLWKGSKEFRGMSRPKSGGACEGLESPAVEQVEQHRAVIAGTGVLDSPSPRL